MKLFCGIKYHYFIEILVIFQIDSIVVSQDSSGFMSKVFDNIFQEEDPSTSLQPASSQIPKRPEYPEVVNGTNSGNKTLVKVRTPKYAIRRRVIKVVTVVEEEEHDCKSRGGNACMTDDQCCLGKCSPLGRCPTASEFFDAAARTLKNERQERRRKNPQQQQRYRETSKNDPHHIPSSDENQQQVGRRDKDDGHDMGHHEPHSQRTINRKSESKKSRNGRDRFSAEGNQQQRREYRNRDDGQNYRKRYPSTEQEPDRVKIGKED